jgi:hypothetical protein
MAPETVTIIIGAFGFVGTVTGSVLLFFNGRRNTDKQITAAEAHLDKRLVAEKEHLEIRVTAERNRQIEADQWTRNAAWHMHKRAVYSDLVKAAQEMSRDETDDAQREWSKERARALIVAEDELREHLMKLASPSLPLPNPELETLVQMMRDDVHPPKKKAPDDNKAEDRKQQADDHPARDGGDQTQPPASNPSDGQ